MGYRQLSARMPPTGGMILSNTGPTEKSPKCPDWLEKELLRREPRRHSLALGDTEKLSMRQRHRGDLANKLYELKVKVSQHLALGCISKQLCAIYIEWQLALASSFYSQFMQIKRYNDRSGSWPAGPRYFPNPKATLHMNYFIEKDRMTLLGYCDILKLC